MLARLVSIALVSILAVALTTIAVSCGQQEELRDRIGVVVTVQPLADFVENVGGKRVDVTVMIPSGASPHTYEPTPSQMRDLARAKMYAKAGSGVEFELVWMEKIMEQNEDMFVVDSSEGVELIEMAGVADHEGGEPEHVAMDPHIWMSPQNAKIMVENISDGLVQVDPDSSAYYERNRDDYLQELAKLDDDIREGLSGVASRIFMVYHPSFGYFAEEYGLTMLPIEEEGKEPTAASITQLIDEAREHGIKVIFTSPQFNPQSAMLIADEIGGRVVFIDSLAGDYIVNLRMLLSELVQAME